MTYALSLRETSDEQFAEGTSLDGTRIDRAAQQLQDAFNNIRRGSVKGRFLPQYHVAGWTPMGEGAGATPYASVDHNAPWMRAKNQLKAAVPPAVDAVFQNPWRHKGHKAQEIIEDDFDIANGAQFAWTTAFQGSKPCILENITLFLSTNNTGTECTNTFIWPAGAPFPPNVATDYVADFNIVVTAANPFAPEDRSKDSLILSFGERAADCCYISHIGPDAPVAEMVPTFSWGPQGGLCIEARELNEPIPAGVRWYVGVLIPQYAEATYETPWGSGAVDDNDRNFHAQIPSLTVVTLEEIE